MYSHYSVGKPRKHSTLFLRKLVKLMFSLGVGVGMAQKQQVAGIGFLRFYSWPFLNKLLMPWTRFLFRGQLVLLESHLEHYCRKKGGTTSVVFQGTSKHGGAARDCCSPVSVSAFPSSPQSSHFHGCELEISRTKTNKKTALHYNICSFVKQQFIVEGYPYCLFFLRWCTFVTFMIVVLFLTFHKIRYVGIFSSYWSLALNGHWDVLIYLKSWSWNGGLISLLLPCCWSSSWNLLSFRMHF